MHQTSEKHRLSHELVTAYSNSYLLKVITITYPMEVTTAVVVMFWIFYFIYKFPFRDHNIRLFGSMCTEGSASDFI